MSGTGWNLIHIRQLFAEHPSSVGESYFQHMRSAHGFALRMVMTGLLCFVHGLLPFLFKQTASRQVEILHDVMVTNRHRGHRVGGAPGSRTGGSDSKVRLPQS